MMSTSWKKACFSLGHLALWGLLLAGMLVAIPVNAAPDSKEIRTLSLNDRLIVTGQNCLPQLKTQAETRIVIRCAAVYTRATGAMTNTSSSKVVLVANAKLVVKANACVLEANAPKPAKIVIRCVLRVTPLMRVSVAPDGSPGAGGSYEPAMSGDGRYVVFESGANNLVDGDANTLCTIGENVVNCPDIFVRDMLKGKTTLVSVASDGTQGNGFSMEASISADGRYVAFASGADNLVSEDTNSPCPSVDNCTDVFVHDRRTGETIRASVASDGTQADDASYNPAISADGRYIAFTSYADNLVGGDTNDAQDVFVHDMQTGQTTRVSVAPDGTQRGTASGLNGPSISANGRYVAFDALGDNNVQEVFVHDSQTGQTILVSVASDGSPANGRGSGAPSISGDGRYVAFVSDADNLVSGDTNNTADTFVHDILTGQTTRVSVASDGTQETTSSRQSQISADGRYVVFATIYTSRVGATPLDEYEMYIMVHDMQSGETALILDAWDYASGRAVISADGHYVAFQSAMRLDTGDANNAPDVFRYQRW